MLLLVGLGNPGARYVGNRHNIGFMAVDAIAERHGIAPWRRRFQGVACEGRSAASASLLLLPGTYMNEFGPRGRRGGAFLQARRRRRHRVPRRDRSAARQGQGQDRRRHRRPQRAALDHRAYRQRLPARAHRRRPSRRQGTGRSITCSAISPRASGPGSRRSSTSSPTMPTCSPRRGCELSEQGASRHARQGFRRHSRSKDVDSDKDVDSVNRNEQVK